MSQGSEGARLRQQRAYHAMKGGLAGLSRIVRQPSISQRYENISCDVEALETLVGEEQAHVAVVTRVDQVIEGGKACQTCS